MNAQQRRLWLCAGVWCVINLAGCATPRAMTGLAPLPPTPRAGGVYHRVERGQTLWRIAQQYHLPLEELVRANRLDAPQRIAPGQLLWVPGATATQRSLPPRAGGDTGGTDDAFQWPVRGDIIAYFGITQQGSTNRGMDIRVAAGTPVRAARSGRVVFIDTNMPGYGQTVIIDHGDGFSTVYAWNGELLVQLGQAVSRATPIATVGSTGRAPSTALHFEIRRGHVPQNPFYFLP